MLQTQRSDQDTPGQCGQQHHAAQNVHGVQQDKTEGEPIQADDGSCCQRYLVGPQQISHAQHLGSSEQ